MPPWGERTRTRGQSRTPLLGSLTSEKAGGAGAGLVGDGGGGGDSGAGLPMPRPCQRCPRFSKSARPRWAQRTERHSHRARPARVYGATPLRRPAGPTPRPEPALRPEGSGGWSRACLGPGEPPGLGMLGTQRAGRSDPYARRVRLLVCGSRPGAGVRRARWRAARGRRRRSTSSP
ncbi:Atypical Chemokine Receptor 1 [Manis pentadactyla]|nr:Atypical Chemokine Receptor 1 [Manis pentadactyla]